MKLADLSTGPDWVVYVWLYNICCTFHSFDFWTWKLVNFRI